MEIKKYSEAEDFPHIVLWAAARGLAYPAAEFYPPCGMVIWHEGKRVCSGFMFKTDANFSIIGGIMSDPKADYAVRNEALDMLFAGLLELSKQCGFKLVSSSANNEKLSARLEKHGFVGRENGLKILLREEP